MFQNAEMMLPLGSTQFWLAQISIEQPASTTKTGMIFSSPQFFVALIAGVIMAFGFQFLLTNLSIAAKISDDSGVLDLDADDDSESFGSQIRQIELKVGTWVLLTVNIALFTACFLAVKLTSIHNIGVAAITGIVIWSAYFLLLLWMGSNAVGSLIGSVVETATAGVQGVMGTAATALGAGAVNSQIVNTVEASVATVRRELSSGLDPTSVRETVEDYLGNLQLPKLDTKQIRRDFEKLLNDPELKSLNGSELLGNVNRQSLVDLVSSRTDLSKGEVNRIAEQLESVWQQVISGQQQKDPQAQVIEFLQSAAPEELKSNDLADKLYQLVGAGQSQSERSNGNGLMERSLQLGVNTLVGTVLARTDLSDLDVEKISSQLQHLKDRGTEQAKGLANKVAERVPAQPYNTIKADVENYLLNSKPWHLNRETIKQEFRDVIYDPEANPGAIRRQLEQLNLDYFTDVLNHRGNFTADQVQEITQQLESIRQEIFGIVQNAESQEQTQDLRKRVEEYLRSTGKEELNPEGIEREFKTLLEDPDAGVDALRERFSQFDRDTLVQLLGQREDFSQEEVNQLIERLESTRDRVLSEAQQLQEQAKSKAQELRQQVESYLRDTNKEELNPEAIKRDFQTLLDDPQAGFNALQGRLSQFDRDTLVQLLGQRQDLSDEQINRVIDQIESVRDSILQAPQKVADTAKERYSEITTKIGDYLRNTNLEELNPEGIQRDLVKLLDDPKQGTVALRERLSQVDRETLVKLLSQRQDLSKEQVNQILDRVQETIRDIVKAPRRLAARAQTKVQDFQSNLESYLRNTQKEELNPESIKRDLQLLLNDPGMGMQNLGDRLSHFDRSTLVSLLSQREDISEEEANQIADQIDSVRHQWVEQVHNVQDKVQSVIDGSFAKVRNYLNSLERPELNYEGVKQDFRKLFDDPEAGFEAVKERLSQFDRNTLVAVLSSREDISEEDANRLINQIEGVRDSVLERSERIQNEAKKRIKDLKKKAKKQLEETREASATAAWWLFGTALTSAATAAIASVIAVAGITAFLP